MPAPFGDYHLTAYTVDTDRAEIRMRAERGSPGEPRVTEIHFTGLEAYHFEHHSGTILGWITEQALEPFLRAQAAVFAEGWRRSGWPSFWRGTVEEALGYLKGESVRAYEIESSVGMRGWVLARGFETRALEGE